MLLILNLPLAGVWVKLLRIPRPYLYAGILMFGALGSYTINLSPVDLALLFALGAMGFMFRRYGWPVAPAIIGVILGPIAEQQLRRALAISQGDASVLVESPFSMALLCFSALVLLIPLVVRLVGRRGPAGDQSRETPGDATNVPSTTAAESSAGAMSGSGTQPPVPASRGTLDAQPKDQP
jgi:putative tricarboxylic transport membrane protein